MLLIVILNSVLAITVLGVIIGGHLWGIATQHRDHGVAVAGALVRRRIWTPRAQPAGVARPAFEPANAERLRKAA